MKKFLRLAFGKLRRNHRWVQYNSPQPTSRDHLAVAISSELACPSHLTAPIQCSHLTTRLSCQSGLSAIRIGQLAIAISLRPSHPPQRVSYMARLSPSDLKQPRFPFEPDPNHTKNVVVWKEGFIFSLQFNPTVAYLPHRWAHAHSP